MEQLLVRQFKRIKVAVKKPTLKAIHICNSHQPTHKPKIAKEYVFANAENQAERNKASG
jgi:hypothetical protein